MNEQTSTSASPHPVERIAVRLHDLLRVGSRPSLLVPYLGILDLIEGAEGMTSTEDPYQRAMLLADRLNDAVASLGDGPMGEATRALFGLTAESRGRLLKDRRRLAADELGLMVSTWRKYYETPALRDVAVALLYIKSERNADERQP